MSAVIIPTSFAVHVTYTCPLACAHCCFSSSPKNKDRLHVEHIEQSIRQLPPDVRLVAFTGGEPFLLGKQLDHLVRVAASLDHVPRIVTSAYWAKSPEKAEMRLAELKKAGLEELSISWDDFHEAFVKFECVYNAFWAAKRLGIQVAINTVQTSKSRWSRQLLLEELGLPADTDEILCESPINLTGRAAEELADEGLREKRTLGPCPYVLTGPTLSAKNKLLACCGVIPETDALIIDDDFRPENLVSDIERAQQSVLLNWLYLRGPYAIMAWMAERYGLMAPRREEVGGNCEACHRLFKNQEFVQLLPQALNERAREISSELALLEILGMLQPREVLAVWHRDSVVVDNMPVHTEKNTPTDKRLLPIRAI